MASCSTIEISSTEWYLGLKMYGKVLLQVVLLWEVEISRIKWNKSYAYATYNKRYPDLQTTQ
jgi:hypothetical protein